MKTREQINRELAEIRGKMADLQERAEQAPSDEARAKANVEFAREARRLDILKVDIEALQLAEREAGEDPDLLRGDGEARAMDRLARRTRLQTYVRSAMGEQHFIKDSAEDELDTELQRRQTRPDESGAWAPWAALAPELRADAASSGPAANTGERINWIQRVFNATAAMFAGVSFRDVPAGASESIVVTGGADGTLAGRGDGVDSDAVALSLHSLTPTRMQAAYLIDQADCMRLGTGYEATLRNDLAGAISQSIDQQCLNGDGSNDNFTGLFNSGTAPTTSTTVVTWETAIERLLSDGLDGVYANGLEQVRSILGVNTAALLARLLRTGQAAEQTALTYVKAHGGGVRVSANAPAVASQNQQGLLYRAGGTGGPDALCAFWGSGAQLLRDDASAATARKGQIRLTMNVYADFAVLRSGAYLRRSFHLS